MSISKLRYTAFSLLIIVAFATLVQAQPDGSHSYQSADWEWAFYSMGNQFVDLASNQFSHSVSLNHHVMRPLLWRHQAHEISKSSSNLPANVVTSHNQVYRSVENDDAAFTQPSFQNGQSMSFDTPRSVVNYVERRNIPTFAPEPMMANQMQNIRQWRPAHPIDQSAPMVPFTTAMQSSSMTQSHTSMDMPYQPMGSHLADQQFLPPDLGHGMPQLPTTMHNATQISFEQPRSYPQQQPESFLLNDGIPPTSHDPITDLNNNYNFQPSMSESAGGMQGWLRRASTFGDRVMPRIDTTHLRPPPTNGLRNHGTTSPSSASTTTSSGRLSFHKRSRAQMMAAGAGGGGGNGSSGHHHLHNNNNHHPFVCHLCRAGFRAQGDLTHHLRCHQPYENRAHLCRTCGKRFQYRKDLNRHLPKHDPNAPRYYCPHHGCKYAAKGFGRQDHLDRHVSTQHRADTPQQGGCSPGFK